MAGRRISAADSSWLLDLWEFNSKLQPPKKTKEVPFLTYEVQVDHPKLSSSPFPNLMILTSTLTPDHWLYLSEVKRKLLSHYLYLGFLESSLRQNWHAYASLGEGNSVVSGKQEWGGEPGRDQSKHKEVKLLSWPQHRKKIQLVAWSLGTFPEKKVWKYNDRERGEFNYLSLVKVHPQGINSPT